MTRDDPDDADGDALRRVASCGNDVTRPLDIHFQIAAPDEFTANRIASEAAELGYATEVTFDDEKLDIEDGNTDFF